MTPIESGLIKLFGLSSAPVYSQSGAVAGLAPIRVAKANGNRLALLFVNLSASDIYISPIPGVSSTFGIFVPPLGGTFSISLYTDLILPSLEWYVVASADNSNYFAVEQLSV